MFFVSSSFSQSLEAINATFKITYSGKDRVQNGVYSFMDVANVDEKIKDIKNILENLPSTTRDTIDLEGNTIKFLNYEGKEQSVDLKDSSLIFLYFNDKKNADLSIYGYSEILHILGIYKYKKDDVSGDIKLDTEVLSFMDAVNYEANNPFVYDVLKQIFYNLYKN